METVVGLCARCNWDLPEDNFECVICQERFCSKQCLTDHLQVYGLKETTDASSEDK